MPRKQPAEKCYKSQKKEGCIEGGSGYYTINWLALIKNKDHMHLLNIYCKQLFDCFEIVPICLMMLYKKFFEIVLDFELKGSINVILLKITSELANTSQKKTWKFLVIQYWASNHHSYIRGRRSLVKKAGYSSGNKQGVNIVESSTHVERCLLFPIAGCMLIKHFRLLCSVF